MRRSPFRPLRLVPATLCAHLASPVTALPPFGLPCFSLGCPHARSSPSVQLYHHPAHCLALRPGLHVIRLPPAPACLWLTSLLLRATTTRASLDPVASSFDSIPQSFSNVRTSCPHSGWSHQPDTSPQTSIANLPRCFVPRALARRPSLFSRLGARRGALSFISPSPIVCPQPSPCECLHGLAEIHSCCSLSIQPARKRSHLGHQRRKRACSGRCRLACGGPCQSLVERALPTRRKFCGDSPLGLVLKVSQFKLFSARTD